MIRNRTNRYSQGKEFHNKRDEELIALYKSSGNTTIMGVLFMRYTHLVYGVCMKYLKDQNKSQDATMDIFEDLHSKLIRHDIKNFKNWIHTVTKNHCMMILRKKTREFQMDDQVMESFHYEIMESDRLFHQSSDDKSEQINKLFEGLKLLKEEQRKCIELLYLQQKSYKEVSEITGYELKKVKSYIQNGKRNLKIFLEKQ